MLNAEIAKYPQLLYSIAAAAPPTTRAQSSGNSNRKKSTHLLLLYDTNAFIGRLSGMYPLTDRRPKRLRHAWVVVVMIVVVVMVCHAKMPVLWSRSLSPLRMGSFVAQPKMQWMRWATSSRNPAPNTSSLHSARFTYLRMLMRCSNTIDAILAL